MSITEPGKVFCCCLHEGGEITTPDDVWNDPYLKNIRAKFDRGEIPDECEACIESEKHSDGRSSRRIDHNKRWLEIHGNYEDYEKNDAPCRFDFWVGNICNLACSTCTSFYSSTWNTLLKRAAGTGRNHRDSIGPENWKPIIEDPPNIDFKNLEWLHFNGGEPLITDTHFRTLENVPKKYRKNIRIEYNTNGTVRVDINNDKWKILKDFQAVNLTFSIDGIGETFEYVRWPGKWETVKDNVDFWVDQTINQDWKNNNWFISFGFNIVKSAYNYNKMDETFEYINNNWINPAKRANPEKFDEYDMVFFCNDHAFMDFTDKDFEDFTKTTRFIREKELMDALRKR
jgi:organic radical activating enzyme